MLHRVLGSLHAFVAFNAIGGGLYGLAGADGIPLGWLAGTPFASYRAPSAILLVAVGGTQGAASALVWRQLPRAYPASVIAGIVLLGWIAVQVAMLGFVSWLQPAMGVTALVTLTLACRLPRGP